MIARRASQSGLLGQLVILVPEIQRAPGSQPITPAIPEIPDQAGRFRMFDAVATFLKETANAEPLLLLVDDLHDADAALVQMLRFIARSLKDSRITPSG